jgi:hypothetical protein
MERDPFSVRGEDRTLGAVGAGDRRHLERIHVSHEEAAHAVLRADVDQAPAVGRQRQRVDERAGGERHVGRQRHVEAHG